MADNVSITPGSGNTVGADEVTDATLGTVKIQYVKLMDGTLDSTTKASVGANGLKVDPSGVTSPVSVSGSVAVTGPLTDTQLRASAVPVSASSLPLPTGAATSAKQPALGTAGTPSSDVITVQGVTSMTALKVDGSATTQPISASSLPLPTGASTAAKQPALGTAGTPSADVITVQGVTSMTALKVDGSAVTQPVSGTITANIGTSGSLALDATVAALTVSQGSTTSGQKGDLNQGAVTTSAPTYTTGTTNPLSLTTAGSLRVDGSGSTQPISGTVTANAGTGSFTVAQATASNLNATVTGTITANIGTSGSLALDASVNALVVSQGSTTSGQKGQLILGAVTTAAPTYTTAQTSPLSLTTAGALRTDGSGTTQPVSGTVTANQGGTWTVQPGNTANTTPWLTEPRSPTLATYSAAATNIAPAATPTDVFTIYGSASKTVKVQRILVTGTQTTAGLVTVVLAKRSTTNTGGTSTSTTAVPNDSNNAAATATCLSYTANPTSTGTLVGNVYSAKILINKPADTTSNIIDLIPSAMFGQPIVLRGTSQGLAVNFNSVTLTGGSVSCTIVWTEE
jgi:hypothetical protein